VKRAALRHGIHPIWQPESVKDPDFAADVHGHEPDLIVVVAFRILPPDVFGAARLGAFNLHGSLLPRYRGAAPINHAIMQGETTTGVTTFFLREQVDTGSIILQKEMSIGPDETAGELHDRMMEIAAGAVVETVRLIERGEAHPRKQDDALATPAPKIHREDCEIRWDRPAHEVHNQIRGLSPYPGAWTVHDNTQLKIFRTRLNSAAPATIEEKAATAAAAAAPDSSPASDMVSAPGTVVINGERLGVACRLGAVEVIEIQQEGKQRLKAGDFLRGYPLTAGDVLG
jgi:methionyl-tRNA formyltransferase